MEQSSSRYLLRFSDGSTAIVWPVVDPIDRIELGERPAFHLAYENTLDSSARRSEIAGRAIR